MSSLAREDLRPGQWVAWAQLPRVVVNILWLCWTGRGRGLLGTLCSACLDKHANKHINIQLGIFHAPWAEHGTHGHNPLSRVSPLRSGGRKVLAIGNFLLQRRYISWRGWKKVEVGLAGKCGKWQFWTSFWILKWKTVFAPPAPRITFTRVRVLKKPTNI